MSWTEAARAEVSRDRLTELAAGLVAIPSRTGDEAALSRYAAAELARAGLRADVQHLDARQANCRAVLAGASAGTGTGRDLLLYAPIDTLRTGRADADLPWAGPATASGHGRTPSSTCSRGRRFPSSPS